MYENIKRFQTMADPNVQYCPYCFRSIDEPMKLELSRQISLLLSKEVEVHQQELSNLKIMELAWDGTAYEGIDSTIEQTILLKVMEINTRIKRYNEEVEAKRENVYEPRSFQDLGIEAKIAEVNNLIKQLEEKRLALQEAIKNRTKLKNLLITLNRQLAHYSIADDYKKYKEQHADYFQWFRLAEPHKGAALNFLNERVNPPQGFLVLCLPIKVILPAFGEKQQIKHHPPPSSPVPPRTF